MDMAYVYLRQGKKGLYKVFKGLKDGDSEASLSVMGFEMDQHEFYVKQPLDGVTVSMFGHTVHGVGVPGDQIFGAAASGAVLSYKINYRSDAQTAELQSLMRITYATLYL